ncbi:hypothetical protein GCM10027088_56770 [Nocardia goodfellowii]
MAAAMFGSKPIDTNSVVPIPNPPSAKASMAGICQLVRSATGGVWVDEVTQWSTDPRPNSLPRLR